jgi:RNA polymerase sigma factor (sigma-70 family)
VGRDRLEFAEFYRASWDPCLRAVTATIVDSRLAEDLVAEAFTKAWVSWREVGSHPAPRAWVVRTALNTGVSWWRRRRREVALPSQESPSQASAGRGYMGQEIAGSAEQGDALDAVLLNAVRRLPAREREVVALRVFLDLDTETTAKHLGIAAGTVRAHLSRAMVALRQDMAPALAMEVSECTTTT